MSDTKINPAGILFYGFILAVLMLAILYVLGGAGVGVAVPVKQAFDSIGGNILKGIGKLNFSGLGIDFGKLVSDNLGTIISAGVGGVMTIGTLLSLRAKKKENEEILEQYKQLEMEKLNVEGQVQGLTTTVGNQAKELEVYASDTTATTLQGRIGEMQDYVKQKEMSYNAELTAKQTTINELHQEVTHLNEVIAELKKPSVIVK